MKRGVHLKSIKMRLICLGSLVLLVACSGSKDSSGPGASSGAQNGPPMSGTVNINITDTTGKLVYSDTSPTGPLQIRATQTYILKLSTKNYPAGTSFQLQITNLSGGTSSIPIVAGVSNISVPTQGDYVFNIIASASGFADENQSYSAAVTCSSPTFTATSLAPQNIFVGATANNTFSLDATKVVTGANGLAPYSCAWDFTGVGILDTNFGDCSQVLSQVYSDLVDIRVVGLAVKDACNTTITVSSSTSVTYVEPSMPGKQFIFAHVGPISVIDRRYDDVTYLATNNAIKAPVNSQYSAGTFVVFSQLNFGMPNSVDHGIDIRIKGLTESIALNPATGAGAINVASAYIDKLQFSTDQASDKAAVALIGVPSACTLSSQNVTVTPMAGAPCAPGVSGTGKILSVEMWGHFSCTNLTGATHTVPITGDFDSSYNVVDCNAQSGGIVPPIF